MIAQPFQNSSAAQSASLDHSRLDYLDATRAFALLLGVVFHASLSFAPIFLGWAVQDISTSPLITFFMTVSHTFRMEMFFLIAGVLGHITFHRRGTSAFLRSRLLRLAVPFVIGWFLLRPLMVSGWIMGAASLRGEVDVGAGLLGGIRSLSSLPAGMFTGTHLWFLYYLMMATAVTLAARGLMTRTGFCYGWSLRRADVLVGWLANRSAAPCILALPTACTLWFMRSWGIDTPDQSLVPHLPALILYAGCFAFGWLLDRQREEMAKLLQPNAWRWIQAIVGIGLILFLGGIERDPAHPHATAAHAAYAFGYAMTLWSLVFLALGLIKKHYTQPSRIVRYLADASYWMYLVHLPLVIWFQIAMAEIPWLWPIKLALICIATVAVALFTYDLFVRSTFVGALLNGRRLARVLTPGVMSTAWRRSMEARADR